MKRLKKIVQKYYKWYLSKPLFALLFVLGWCIWAGYNIPHFYYDASSDTLVAENDPDLLYYREVSSHFGGEDFLFLTYTPESGNIISPKSLQHLDTLTQRIKAIEGVKAVTSILDAPLLKSPPIEVSQLAHGYKTLRKVGVDLNAAFIELTTSPLFKDLLISKDGKTTAIRIALEENAELQALFEERNELRLLKNKTLKQQHQLRKVNAAYRKAYADNTHSLEVMLDQLRDVRDSIQGEATAYLGGIPMIASDMMNYVKKDVIVFGTASVILILITLFVFFRKTRWLVIPIVSTAITILIMVGLLGFMQKPVSVISANFISLLIILSISISVHLINRYREVLDEDRKLSHFDVVYQTMVSKFAPCFYTTLTTCVGFASLATSSIVPVMDFGWIMCMGVSMSFLVAFLFFPTALLMIPKEVLTGPARDNNTPFIRHSYRTAYGYTNGVILVGTFLVILTALGISKLSLDNRFIDYFKSSTEIYQGLAFIDKNIGGTIPMDIIVNYPPYVPETLAEDDDFFDDSTDKEEDTFPQRYWFTADKIEQLHKLSEYLDYRKEIGKVISLATLERIAQGFNDDKPLSTVELVATLGALPDNVRNEFIAPYASPENGIMRISTRIHETGPLFSRDALINDIESYAVEELGFKEGQVKATGMNVLFNGMLKELFSSQASTLIFVILATLGMFWVLLSSARLAILGLMPNVLSAFLILGFMGFFGMPLDMMTITISAIVIGIGVDDAIHYLYHFKEEHLATHDTDFSVRKSHREIGRAIYITSLTVVIGFSVLCASNFVPTIYFGLLTAVAMIFALTANLVILPALLLKFYK